MFWWWLGPQQELGNGKQGDKTDDAARKDEEETAI